MDAEIARLQAEVERLTRDQDCSFCGVKDGHLHENWCRAGWHSEEEWEYLNRELGKAETVVRTAEHLRKIISPSLVGQAECDRLDEVLAAFRGRASQ